MERKIKLIWDFRGPDAQRFAEHHAIHLKEFAQKESLVLRDAESMEQGQNYWIASLVVVESEMIKVRDALRPHRGVLT